MRCLLKVELCTDTANTAIRDGSLGKTIRSILDDLKPEAAYFLAANGKRTAYIFLDIQMPHRFPLSPNLGFSLSAPVSRSFR